MNFFPKYIDLPDNKKFAYLQVQISESDFAQAIYQSFIKSRYTMNLSQSEEERDDWEKFNKQFEGVISEMACLQLLKRKLKLSGCTISRFDDNRLDEFKFAENEYDLRIDNGHIKYDFEIRASILYENYKFGLNTLKNIDIIGKYVNDSKKSEKINDYYIRPLFELSEDIKIDSKENKDEKQQKRKEITNNFIYYVITGKAILYLMCGCTKSDMLSSKSKIKNMGQNNTEYRCIPMIDVLDIFSFLDKLNLDLKPKKGDL